MQTQNMIKFRSIIDQCLIESQSAGGNINDMPTNEGEGDWSQTTIDDRETLFNNEFFFPEMNLAKIMVCTELIPNDYNSILKDGDQETEGREFDD